MKPKLFKTENLCYLIPKSLWNLVSISLWCTTTTNTFLANGKWIYKLETTPHISMYVWLYTYTCTHIRIYKKYHSTAYPTVASVECPICLCNLLIVLVWVSSTLALYVILTDISINHSEWICIIYIILTIQLWHSFYYLYCSILYGYCTVDVIEILQFLKYKNMTIVAGLIGSTSSVCEGDNYAGQ